MKIGFVGLGLMGAPMAANLVRKGFRVRVWNRTSERTAALVKMGASRAEVPADCAREAQVVMV